MGMPVPRFFTYADRECMLINVNFENLNDINIFFSFEKVTSGTFAGGGAGAPGASTF